VPHALGLILVVGVTACATQAPIDRWRADTQEYVAAHACDANLLRDYADMTSSPDARPALLRFSTLGIAAGLGRTCDVLSVLVGFPRVETAHWYVFLVATVDVQSGAGFNEAADAITDIRAVGLRWQGGQCTWRVGEAAPDATQRYVQARLDKPAEQVAHMLFPGRDDVFTLDVSGSSLVVTERGSGARWPLSLHAE
jgi:hypothetical protein